ncbi:protein PELPK1-like [Agrilus planipennis]|uniref:Protein PELPK1-like n=1 Tax=Agrilus planipennis TaxID=224129 RepID=A0A1W4WTQ0_AGRPL|nr:protein PELPK1-like [Agrilus planipennis]XP_025837126.1 protein PELPK1-like [Agrilus planipennis]
MPCKHCFFYKGRSKMWHKTFLLLSVLLSFINAEQQDSFVQNDKRFQLAVSGDALVPAAPEDSDDDFQASHAVHLKTSNGVKIKLLLALPPDLQPATDDNEENSEQAPTVPLLPADPSTPIESDLTPETPEVDPSEPEIPVELPVEEELPIEQPPSIPNVPSVPSGDGPSSPSIPDVPYVPSGGGSSSVFPIVFRTINGVHVRLHVNVPPEFQHIIEAHESITVPESALPQRPVYLPVPQPEPIEDELQTPTVPEPEKPEEPIVSNPDQSEDEPQRPIIPKPQPIPIPEEPTNSNPDLSEDEPQRPIIPRPEPIPVEPISVPEEKPIGLKPLVLETENGIKVKLFIDVPPHLASLIDINQSIEGPSVGAGPVVPNIPGNENPSAPDAETPANPEPEVPATPELEVPDTPELEVPTTPELEVPATPEVEVPATPELEGPESDIPSDSQQPSLPETPETGGVIKVPDPSDLVPEDQHIKLSTDSGVELHVKISSPIQVRHLVQQKSAVVYVNN